VRIGDAAGGDGPLTFVPDALLADAPDRVERVERGLREAYRRLCELEWDTLLLAHGLPLIRHGKDELRAFTEGSDFARAAARADGSPSAAIAGGRVARMRIRCAERAEEPNRYECLHCASPTACALASVRFVT